MSLPTLVDGETLHEIFDYFIENAQQDMVYVEVGVFVGGSICYLSNKLKEKNVQIKIIAVDNFKFEEIHQQHIDSFVRGHPYISFNNNMRKHSVSPIVMIGDSIEVSKTFQNKSIDFLFLDGCHDSPYVENELKAWLPKLKDNAMIAGHDYIASSAVQQATKEILGKVSLTSNKTSYYKIIGNGLSKVENITKIRWLKKEKPNVFMSM